MTPERQQIGAMLAALVEAENALTDYIETLERQGAKLNYGRNVLAQVRAAIASAPLP